ncbi:hypothetical protein ABE501_18455 [Comamonas testosteroni]
MIKHHSSETGELVPADPKTSVFLRSGKELRQFEAGTSDHVQAISMVREHLGHRPVGRNGKWSGGPVLALIQGGRKSKGVQQ